MSVTKMGTRIAEAKDFDRSGRGDPDVEKELYDSTFGLANDPLIQFACVFSALIHDLVRRGGFCRDMRLPA